MSDSDRRVGRIGNWSGNQDEGSRGANSNRRFATLSDFASGSHGGSSVGGGGGHGGFGPGVHHLQDDDDEDDGGDKDEDSGEDWYTGGERSGLSVHSPNSRNLPGIVRDLLMRSSRAGPPPPAVEASASRGAFGGGGHTLGSDEVESRYIPDPSSQPGDEQERVIRHITFWRNGFSIGDGPLLSFDDPQNARTLKMIQEGLAPPELGIEVGQPVEVRVESRTDIDYIPPERPRGPFDGTGRRLGAPMPTIIGPSVVPMSTASASTSAPRSIANEPESLQTKFEVDHSQPTTSIQIRLADGTRMNLTHTMGDIRNFIIAARPENRDREFTIATAYPNRILDDDTPTIQDAGLANSVIVQRWV